MPGSLMTRMILSAAVAAIILLLGASALSKPRSKARIESPPVPPTLTELENTRLQRERLEFDKDKAKSDAERAEKTIKVEESKVFWSALATGVPLAVGVIAIAAGVWNQNRQARNQFELKAAEIIFSGTTPQAVLRRGKALKAIFGTNLSRDFLSDFKPENIGDPKEPSEQKLAFLDHVLKTPDKQADIVKLWFALFPGDFRWLARFAPEQFKDLEFPEIQRLFATITPEERSNEDPKV